MRRLNFRLTLEPGLDGVVRLAQLHQYASDLVDGERALIGPALRAQVKSNFPRRKVEAVLDALLGEGPPGWDIEGASQESPLLVIKTVGAGMAISAVARIIEQIVPESLPRPMTYEPNPEGQNHQQSRRLH